MNTNIKHGTIKIIDLFAGIGGIRLGFELAAKSFNIKTQCVFTSEIDEHACKTYNKNFENDNHSPLNDITKTLADEIPEFDVLLAGFPCQAFSIAGKKGGFNDTRGTLFFEVARLLKEHKPKAFILENVKGLVRHRGGKTLATILNVLINDLGYKSTRYHVLNSKDFGVPQNRERVYIVGFKDGGGSFSYPKSTLQNKAIKDIIENKPVSVKYYLSETYYNSLVNHKNRHANKGNGFGFVIKDLNDVASAIVVGGMGKERNLIIDKRQKNLTPVTHIKGEVNKLGIRRMTPTEWERLQGFPDGWTAGVADAQRYKQLGNSVSVPVIQAVSINLIKELIKPVPFVAAEQQEELFNEN